MSAPLLYEKCRHCHLFVGENDAYVPGRGIARLIHLVSDEGLDEWLDASHEPEGSGMLATLDTWRVFGPSAMRERFLR